MYFVVLQRQVPTFQRAQKTVEVPLVQNPRLVVDVLVVLQRQVPTILQVQKTVEFPKCASLTELSTFQSLCGGMFPPI